MFGAKTIVMLSVVAALTLGGGVYAVAENLHQPLPPQKSATEFAPRPVPAKPIPPRAKDPSHKPPLPPSLAEKPPQGIVENGQAPLPPRYAIQNQWQARQDDGDWLQVWAGSLRDDPEQGLLVVQQIKHHFTQRETPRVIEAPYGAGSLKIVSAKGMTLHLVDASGGRFRFDARIRELRPETSRWGTLGKGSSRRAAEAPRK
jgi:hypothetical protein